MDRIARTRIVPAATVENTDQALKLAGALMDGGLDIVEFTFRTEAAGKAIAAVAREFPDMRVGAGTVLNEDQVRRSVDAGAGFAVAPGLNPKVAELAMRMGLSFIPGVATPTEIEAAMALGIKLLKFFPAENLGGMKMLSALSGPYGHTGIKFLPTGGIGASNARDYLALPIVAAVGGSWMVAKELVKAGDWGRITAISRDAVAMVAALR